MLAAALLAVDPVGTGGVWLRAPPGPTRDRWVASLRGMLPTDAPFRRVPARIADDRLLGGLDLAATLQTGRPVAQRGVLAESDGGIVLLAMAERVDPGTAARLVAVQDTGAVVLERDGLGTRTPARLGLVALDEGVQPDERPPAGLLDRLAFHLDLTEAPLRPSVTPSVDAAAVATARDRIASVRPGEDLAEALCAAALALGIASIRAPLLALRVACAAAALAGHDEVSDDDATLAVRLVYARRATTMPEAQEPENNEAPPPQPPEGESESKGDPLSDLDLTELLIAATQSAIPPDLLSQLHLATGDRTRARSAGRAGQAQRSTAHGRPIGARAGQPGGGVRLHLLETLKAAAPWQRLRAAEPGALPGRIAIRRDDFRTTVYRQRRGTTTIFIVDASGSAALQRLAETKGAVEQLLADCYVRRDKVALIAFRGSGAELLLPPTNALARARRSLAGLPGGGATPLASGIEAALTLADTVARSGQTVLLTLLTDGRANIARDGTPGRPAAEADALAAAARVRAAGFSALLVDTSPRPHPSAQRLAAAMGAHYVPLPHVDAAMLSRVVRATAAQAQP